MTPAELKAWRESQRLTQKQLAELLNNATGRRYDGATVGAWEKGRRGIPGIALDFLSNGGEAPAVDEPGGTLRDGDDGPPLAPSAPSASGEDVPPAVPLNAPKPLGLVAGNDYAKACEDLWDMMGFTLVASGTAFKSPALVNDGRIISGWEDANGKHAGMKRELGIAYGKLTERNRTFQRIMLALSQESVWAEVTVITTKLCVEMYRNHQRYAVIEEQQRQAHAEAQAQAA